MQNPDSIPPLICELDGALLRTSLRSERRVEDFRYSLQTLMLSRFGTASHHPDIEASGSYPALPINEELLDFLLRQKASGQKLVLLTRDSSEDVIRLLEIREIFDSIIEAPTAEQLRKQFSAFDYVGTSTTEDNVWTSARHKYVVEATPKKISQRLGDLHLEISGCFLTTNANALSVYRSLRVYQWIKNLLVFVPIITSQQLTNPTALLNTLIIFVCFSLTASIGYIINDLLDLQSDRRHPVKFSRPFASGALSVSHGLIICSALIFLAILGCSLLPLAATLALGCYLALTVFYSMYLKTKVMIDVIALGGLFTLRVIGGAAAIDSELSFYLLSFSIFIFSSLAMVKRFAELKNLQQRKKLTARGRGYRVEDLEPVRIIGIALGYMSIFVMGQYINSPVVTDFYDRPKLLWLLFPLLSFWLGRLWILANRGEVNEDPLIFAMKDRTSLLVVAVAAATLVAAD